MRRINANARAPRAIPTLAPIERPTLDEEDEEATVGSAAGAVTVVVVDVGREFVVKDVNTDELAVACEVTTTVEAGTSSRILDVLDCVIVMNPGVGSIGARLKSLPVGEPVDVLPA